MRISFVVDTFCGGGKERRCLQLVQGLNNAGIEDIQLIIINDTISYNEIFLTTAKIIVINRKKLRLSLWQTHKILKAHLEEFHPDIIQGWGYLALFFLNIIRLSKNFIYIAAHVADANRPKGKTKIINSCAKLLCDAIVGNSLAGLKAYGAPKEKSYCFYNGYNQERLKRVSAINTENVKKRLGIDVPYVVTMSARVDSYKDYDCFVRIALKVCSLRKDICFLAMGTGPMLEEFQRRTKDTPRIKFIGFYPEVEQVLSITTVSILCTNYKNHAEGISNSILESMAFGIPVVATLGGGTPEIITNGVNGYCIINNNVEDFVNKIIILVDNKHEYDKFSTACKNVVTSRFSLENSTKEYINLYSKLLKE